MTDQEIIQALIARDNQVTQEFFFVRCRPLLCRVMRLVFDHPVDYDEVVNELYRGTSKTVWVMLSEDARDAVRKKSVTLQHEHTTGQHFYIQEDDRVDAPGGHPGLL